MRVLLVSGEFPPMQGGVGDYTALLARHLATQGIDIAIATRAASSASSQHDHFETPVAIGSAAAIVPASPPGGSVDSRADRDEPNVFRVARRWDFFGFRQVARVAASWQADIIHLQYQAAAFDMHPAANLSAFLLRRWPVIVTFHDLKVPYLFRKAGPLRPLAVRLLALSAQACLATNDEDAAELRRSRFARRSQLDVVPIGSNILPAGPVDRIAVRHELGVADGETLLAYFGFLHPSKGVDVLLNALAALIGRGRRVRLMMLGGHAGDSDLRHASYRRMLHSVIASHSLENYVLWTGFLTAEDVSARLTASDVVVLPFADGASYRHGTLHAAMIHGLPIITTSPRPGPRNACLPVLRDGVNALLVPPGDVAALCDAVQRLIDEPELRPRLSAGVARLAEHFSWPAIAAQTVPAYERVLGRRVVGSDSRLGDGL